MAITEFNSNTATVSTTELDLLSNTTFDPTDGSNSVGVYQILLDLAALATGDQFKLVLYERVRSTSTTGIVFSETYTGAQTQPIYISPALTLMHDWSFTLKKLAGTDREIHWSIRKVG